MVAISRQIGWYLIICSFVIFIIRYIFVKLFFRSTMRDFILEKIQSQIKKKNKDKIDLMIETASQKMIDLAYEESDKVIKLTNDLKNIAISIEKSSKSKDKFNIDVYRFLDNYRLEKNSEQFYISKFEPHDLKLHIKSTEEPI